MANALLKFARSRQYRPAQEEKPEDGLLKSVGRKALSGLGMAANVLAVPGDLARAALTGGDVTAPLRNPTSSEGRVGGREFLRKLGLIGKKDTTANFWAGLAADVATDPTTYLTFGASAVSKGGQALKAVGALDDVARIASQTAGRKLGKLEAGMSTTLGRALGSLPEGTRKATEGFLSKAGTSLAQEADKPLRGLVGVGLPFRDPAFVLGTGKTAQKLGKALDVAGAAAKASPVGRAARMLLDPSVRGTYRPIDQRLHEMAYRNVPAAKRAARQNMATMMDRYKSTFDSFEQVYGNPAGTPEVRQKTLDLFDRLVRFTGETGTMREAWNYRQAQQGALSLLGKQRRAAPPQLVDDVLKLAENIQEINRQVHSSIESKGGWTAWVKNYMPRYLDEADTDGMVGNNRLLPTAHAGMLGRRPAIRDIPREVVDAIRADPLTRGPGASGRILEKYGKFLDPQYGKVVDEAGNVIETGSPQKHAVALAQWASGQKELKGFKWQMLPDDFMRYQTGAQTVDRSLDAIHELVSESLIPEAPIPEAVLVPGTPRPEMLRGVSVRSAYERAGMNGGKALEYLAKRTGKTLDELERASIPSEVADAIVSTLSIQTVPEWQARVGKAIDYATNVFKRAVTLPFPSFWTRNFVGGQYNNIASGLIQSPQDLADYGRHVAAAAKMLKNPPKELLDELYVQGIINNQILSQGVDAPESLSSYAASVLWSRPIPSPLDVRGAIDTAAATTKEAPSGIAGVDALRTGYGAVQNVGARASHAVEFMNRVPLYLYLKERGWDLTEAANKVADLHVDYTALAPAEKEVMRRLVPFYSWQRRMGPVILQNILERPGGPMATTVKAMGRARDPNAMTPDYVAETASIPLGKRPDGSDTYLTGFGLPLETPLAYLGGVRGAGLEAMSQLNPLVKAPLEYFTGQSFFQKTDSGGRPLDDLDPTLGRLVANLTGRDKAVRMPQLAEVAVANLPTTRLLTSARQLTDPRKGPVAKAANLLTGFRVTDVPPAAQDAILRERVQELLKAEGARPFVKVSVPKDELATMPPEQQQRVRELQDVLNLLARRTKQRRQAKEKAAK